MDKHCGLEKVDCHAILNQTAGMRTVGDAVTKRLRSDGSITIPLTMRVRGEYIKKQTVVDIYQMTNGDIVIKKNTPTCSICGERLRTAKELTQSQGMCALCESHMMTMIRTGELTNEIAETLGVDRKLKDGDVSRYDTFLQALIKYYKYKGASGQCTHKMRRERR